MSGKEFNCGSGKWAALTDLFYQGVPKGLPTLKQAVTNYLNELNKIKAEDKKVDDQNTYRETDSIADKARKTTSKLKEAAKNKTGIGNNTVDQKHINALLAAFQNISDDPERDNSRNRDRCSKFIEEDYEHVPVHGLQSKAELRDLATDGHHTGIISDAAKLAITTGLAVSDMLESFSFSGFANKFTSVSNAQVIYNPTSNYYVSDERKTVEDGEMEVSVIDRDLVLANFRIRKDVLNFFLTRQQLKDV